MTPTFGSKRFRAKWVPVRVKKTRQSKKLEPGFDFIKAGKALAHRQRETAEVGADDQAGLTARQRQNRAVLVGQHHGLRTTAADSRAGAGLAINTGHVGRTRMLLTVP